MHLFQGFSKLIQDIVISMEDLKIDVAALKNTVDDHGKAYWHEMMGSMNGLFWIWISNSSTFKRKYMIYTCM